MVAEGAAGGCAVTSGQFTADTFRFAKENNVQLIYGKNFRR